MTEKTKIRLVVGLFIAFLVICIIVMVVGIYEIVKAESIETLVNEYPVWVVTAQGDSTFQTVQIVKCRQTFPNGQEELLGYKVVVDSSGIRIYEEESAWFLNWAVRDALRLQTNLTKKGNKMELKMKDSKGNEFGVENRFRSSKEGELPLVKCVAISKNVDRGNGKKRVARMEWISSGKQFDINQKNLLTSYWIKVEPSHIPAQRGKGD